MKMCRSVGGNTYFPIASTRASCMRGTATPAVRAGPPGCGRPRDRRQPTPLLPFSTPPHSGIRMLQLYTYYRSVSSHRVRIALNYKGLSYKSIFIDEDKGEQDSAEY